MDKGKKKTLTVAAGALAVLCVAAVALVFLFVDGSAARENEVARRAGNPAAGVSRPGERQTPDVAAEKDDVSESEDEAGNAEAEGDEEEGRKAAEELQEEEDDKKAEAFDSLTDKWMGKTGGEVTMKDMDDFVAAFKSVPDARKNECLQRALNLVSDDHVLLLAGILFDKSVDKEYLELVFNDVLNRDEEVKKLILPKIFKDKEHPCWADAAWILDATGELPKKEKSE